MGGWKQESLRFFTYVTAPIAAMWIFNQPFFFNWAFGFNEEFHKEFVKKANEMTPEGLEMRRFREEMMEQERQDDRAKYLEQLREQMAEEETKKFRQQQQVTDI